MTFFGFLVANGVFWTIVWVALALLFSTNPTGKDADHAIGCGMMAAISIIYLIAVAIGGWVS